MIVKPIDILLVIFHQHYGLISNDNCFNPIFRVGQAMASTEDKAYEIMRELDVNYVLVIFGGLTGYSSDGEPLFFNEPHLNLFFFF